VQRELLRWHWHGTEQAGGLLIAADDQEKKDASLYNYLNWLQKQKDAEELKRLLYVGVTRARVRAILSGCAVKSDDTDEFAAPAGSMLALLRNILSHSALPVGVEPSSQSISAQTPVSDVAVPQATTGLYRLSRDRLRDASMTLPAADRAPAIMRPVLPIQSRSHRVERAAGVITHRILELLSGTELPLEPDARIKQWIRGGLQKTSLAPDAMKTVEEHCLRLLSNTLSCATGRWILGDHPEAHSELALSRMESGEMKGYVIDRTFIDPETGVRWIIDYKTSAPLLDESLDGFTAREHAHYRGQLQTYAQLLAEQPWAGPHAAIKTALYFPSIQVLSMAP
jgi:ATP-dependent exoDNAse (exonuclease V) beta subunit